MKYAVSACLLGKNCKYNGGNNLNENIVEFLKDKQYIAICPECTGGLPTPRYPAEIIENQVINSNGDNVTYEYMHGAQLELSRMIEEGIEAVILQVRSPSCGIGKIYDGTFQKKLIDGDGMFVKLCKQQNILLIPSNQFDGKGKL